MQVRPPAALISPPRVPQLESYGGAGLTDLLGELLVRGTARVLPNLFLLPPPAGRGGAPSLVRSGRAAPLTGLASPSPGLEMTRQKGLGRVGVGTAAVVRARLPGLPGTGRGWDQEVVGKSRSTTLHGGRLLEAPQGLGSYT